MTDSRFFSAGKLVSSSVHSDTFSTHFGGSNEVSRVWLSSHLGTQMGGS